MRKFMRILKRGLKKLLENGPLIVVTIIALAMWVLFLWMMFGWVLEIAGFHAFMNIYAG